MNKSLNIAFYCSSTSWGGLEMNLLKRTVWMADRSHQVHLFCVKDSPLYNEAKEQVRHLVSIDKNSKGLNPGKSRKLSRLFKNRQIDVIWCTDKHDISILGSAKKNAKLLYQQQMTFGVAKKDIWHTRIYKRIDYWIAPLNYLKRQVLEMTYFPADRIHVIPLTMDVGKFLEGLPSKEKAREYFKLNADDLVIGMIGRIDFAKSQQFVKGVVEELQFDHKNLKMLMVGNKTEGEWEDYYEQIAEDIEKNHADGSIQLYPFMKEVGFFYQAIDVFVMASKNETFGMVTVEAMLAGKKIAGTNSAGTAELLNEAQHGYYFNWMDAESLKMALTDILKNPEEADAKASAASDYAKKNMSHHHELEMIEQLLVP